MSRYDFLKSQVFSWWRKVGSDCDVVISSGRVFQTWGPATENARSLTVERLTDSCPNALHLSSKKLMICIHSFCPFITFSEWCKLNVTEIQSKILEQYLLYHFQSCEASAPTWSPAGLNILCTDTKQHTVLAAIPQCSKENHNKFKIAAVINN